MFKKLLMTTMVLVAGLAFTACQSNKTGTARAAQTSDALDNVDRAVLATSDQVAATMASLKDLRDFKEGDLLSTYNIYKKNLEDLSKSYVDLTAATTSLGRAVSTRMVAWEAENTQIQNEEIRAAAEARRAKASGNFTEVEKALADATASGQSLIGTMTDIKRFLDNDLTLSGLDSIGDFATSAKTDAKGVRENLDALSATIEKLRGTMAMSAPTPETK